MRKNKDLEYCVFSVQELEEINAYLFYIEKSGSLPNDIIEDIADLRNKIKICLKAIKDGILKEVN